MLNLFALTSNPAKRIARFSLSNIVQRELTSYIKIQEAAFEDAEEEVEFDGKYKPDIGEVLFVDGYDDIDDLQSAILAPLGVEEVDPTEEFFGEIKSLFTGYAQPNGVVKILLQNFDRRKVISTNGLSIFHSTNVYKKIEGIGLTVDHKLSAILEGGKLKFFSFHAARQIFDLSEYYKVATDEDVRDFSQQANVQVGDIARMLEISDSWVRRKISLIQQSGILQSVPINDMKAVALEFNIPLVTLASNGTEVIVVPDNKPDLKKLLRFLDEGYYKSPLSNTSFVTNSKRAI